MVVWWTALKRTLAVLFAVGLLGAGTGIQAQGTEPVRLSKLEIALWPEFDRPQLLVIFQGRLADDVSLPAVLTLTMPAAAGEPHAVASVDEQGQRLTAAYTVQTTDEETQITYTALEHLGFQFEYYWDVIQVTGNRHEFAFAYALDVPIDDLTLELQQPLDASHLTLTPTASQATPGFGNLTYHLLPLGALPAGQEISWQVSYDKASSRLSVEAVPTSAPVSDASASDAPQGNASLGAVLAVGAALIVVAGGFWYLGSRQRGQPASHSLARMAHPQSARKRKDRKKNSPQSQKDPAAAHTSQEIVFPAGSFCHRCGAALAADALFCHRCGTPRKGT